MMKRMILKMMIVIWIYSSSCSGQVWSGRLGPRRRFSNYLPRYSVPFAEPEPQPEPFRRWTLSRPFGLPLPEPEPEPVPETLVTRKLRPLNQQLRLPPTTSTTTTTTTTEYIRALVGVKESVIPVEDDVLTPSPWSIDTAQFQIVAAVPEHDKERVDNEGVNENIDTKVEKNEIPSKFMPVPAVPSGTDDMLSRQPKNIVEDNDDVVNFAKEEEDENDKNGKCLEKCVQQFCITDKDLSLFSSCVEKCKSFCV